jgi:hypothetical protein
MGQEAHNEQLKEMDNKMSKEVITNEIMEIEVKDVNAAGCGCGGNCGCGSHD